MEPVTTWTPETVCSYLRGLHSSVQHYPFQEWDVTGHDLLALSPQRLDALGVRSIGHQELILEAVEQLCALHYELHSENLRSLTDKLFRVSQSLCTHILSLRKVSLHSSTNAISPTQKQLVCIVDIVSAARGLFSWLNRHLFTRLNDYSASREIIALCIALSENLQEDWSDAEIENKILTICQSICGICKSILNCSPTILLNQTATLELVHISPEQPDSKLGINIKSTSSGLHFVCGTELETTQFTTRQRSGSENSQTETILLTPQSSVNLRHTLSDSNLFKSTHPSSPLHTELQSGEDSTERVVEKRDSVDNNKNTEKNKQPSVKRKQAQQTKPKSSVPLRNQKGTTTKLSRRRVSCRDLGLPDCDGYLWKKKENVGFMSQRWKHCWCVLKGSRLFWYNSPQDEKALGLVNVSTYKLESTLDSKHKKKYEFQLCHATYKPFVFAADNLDDMNKWVTCLVKTLHKYKLPSNASHPPEEECYSETEAEQDDDQPRTQEMSRKQIVQSPVKNLKVTKTSVSQAESMAAGASPALKGDESQYEGDDLKIMISCLQQGGVSLIGTKTTMTREEYRKSFIRRSKNPDINHKAHTLRVLQSTLKAKLSELDTLNQILDNPDISSEAFRQWKLKNEQLYETIGRGTRARESLGDFLGNLEAERSQKKSESEPSD
ncbi:Connector enhancer of kinase suppressor of ras 1 [Pelobates cultripes]|uniref:Connector enhancer of kinase suppressor of ras 1 n=1 Tax=Pelobates cultripes TaxID=61616 RepID=A0AAD1VL41_PELCU|nr:Connector enhancer of kinase suppressor of ras 1 [Pelobates cultripes]